MFVVITGEDVVLHGCYCCCFYSGDGMKSEGLASAQWMLFFALGVA